MRARQKPVTATEYARLWTKHVLPALGTRHVAAVTTGGVARLHRRMRATPCEVNRVLALLSGFFAFAEREHVRARHDNRVHDVTLLTVPTLLALAALAATSSRARRTLRLSMVTVPIVIAGCLLSSLIARIFTLITTYTVILTVRSVVHLGRQSAT